MTREVAEQRDERQALHLLLIERMLNGYLSLDERARTRLLALEDKTLGIDVRGTGWHYCLHVRDGRCRLSSGVGCAPDATLSGAPLSLLKMAASDGVAMLFSRQVELRGDAELAKRFKRLFDTLDIDWEEHLARIVGDYPARRVMRMLLALGAWRARSTEALGEDIGDYLSEEEQLLGACNQVADLHDAVDDLRDDVARLEARVARYEHHQHNA
ncbi:MAG: SCP2 sterol-binding domain-containing protein [Gammaproteobacteria bacterium]|nr:SCP2 sterol-binding domain-containing protein [Gammaproteobacteria bacterium]